MYKIIACANDRMTLEWIGDKIDPDPASTITFRIDNSDSFFRTGDKVEVKLALRNG